MSEHRLSQTVSRPITNFQLRSSRCSGFTLLELLIAIMVFSVIVTTIYGSLRAVLSKNDAIMHGSDIHEMARTCLNRIILDLNALYVELPPFYKQPGFNDPPNPYRFVAEKTSVGTKYYSKLRFTSTAHLPMAGNSNYGIGEIIYYIMKNEDPDANPVLKRADRSYPFFQNDDFKEREEDPTLCEDVDELTFTYYDEDGQEHDEWNSESDYYKYATPRMIGIRLKIKRNSETYTFYTKVMLPVYREQFK